MEGWWGGLTLSAPGSERRVHHTTPLFRLSLAHPISTQPLVPTDLLPRPSMAGRNGSTLTAIPRPSVGSGKGGQMIQADKCVVALCVSWSLLRGRGAVTNFAGESLGGFQWLLG